MAQRIKPLNGKLIAHKWVPPKSPDSTTPKLILTVEPEEENDRFVVVEIEPKLDIKAGDIILVNPYQVTEKHIDDETVYIISIEHVMAIIEP